MGGGAAVLTVHTSYSEGHVGCWGGVAVCVYMVTGSKEAQHRPLQIGRGTCSFPLEYEELFT